MQHLTVFLLHELLDAIDLHFTDVDLVLILRILNFSGFVKLFLRGGYPIQLHAHVLNLLGLRVVDVRLSRDIAVALFDFDLGRLKLLSYVALGLLCLRKLNFNVTQ